MHLSLSIALIASVVPLIQAWDIHAWPASRGGCYNSPTFARTGSTDECIRIPAGYVDLDNSGEDLLALYTSTNCAGRPEKYIESFDCEANGNGHYKSAKVVTL